ncbi:MAG: hypothetical protein M3N13_01695, partial [Candidatus Eremiobacteraeota bacterium]|nr:hypothetical protein [Candidatus Eremiobacteraeota bacterium]
GTWLISDEEWDINNNLASTTPPRGGTTNYAYDANGNTIAVAQPAPAAGAYRPTSLYSYDIDQYGNVFDNVTAYCDPVATHRILADWQGPPSVSDNLCPHSAVAIQYVFSHPASQPYGRLEQSTSPGTVAAPNGYRRTYSYAADHQGGLDYGLPTQVQGDVISQPDPAQPTRQPLQTFWYDANGQVQCYSSGSGYWLVVYDGLERMIRVTDPDDGTAAPVNCAKTGGQPGWNTATTFAYFPDGSTAASQTPQQRALGQATQFTWDLDGNPTSETHASGCTAAPCTMRATTKFYDGADRLVEVMLPYGPGDAWQTPWRMRYIYDLSQGGSVSIPGATFRAYGNLAVTQEYLPADISHPPWSWKPLKATAFDAVDRDIADYAFAPGASAAYATTQSYDAAGQAGLLSSKTDALNQTTTYSYDGVGRRSAVQFQNALSATYFKQFTFDANGRHLTDSSGLFGTQTNVYDWTGVLLTRSVPAYGPVPATTLKYEYYPDGMAKDINATVASLSQTTPLETWAYRADGRRASTILNYANKTYTLSESYTSAGRPQTTTDNFRTTSATYDGSGQMSSLVLPAGPFTSIAHDPEGAVTSYTGYQNYFSPSGTTITNSLTVRGELLGQSYAPDFAYDHTPLTPSHSAVAANGYIDTLFNGIDIWDVRTKMPLSQWGDPGDTGQTLAYDTVGRLVSSNDGWRGWNSNGNEIEHSGSYTKAYDAENHLV